jgi:hypothetical protein
LAFTGSFAMQQSKANSHCCGDAGRTIADRDRSIGEFFGMSSPACLIAPRIVSRRKSHTGF